MKIIGTYLTHRSALFLLTAVVFTLSIVLALMSEGVIGTRVNNNRSVPKESRAAPTATKEKVFNFDPHVPLSNIVTELDTKTTWVFNDRKMLSPPLTFLNQLGRDGKVLHMGQDDGYLTAFLCLTLRPKMYHQINNVSHGDPMILQRWHDTANKIKGRQDCDPRLQQSAMFNHFLARKDHARMPFDTVSIDATSSAQLWTMLSAGANVLKPGGFMVVHDALRKDIRTTLIHFAETFIKEYQLVYQGPQVWLQKKFR